jgi:hypothetical protein
MESISARPLQGPIDFLNPIVNFRKEEKVSFWLEYFMISGDFQKKCIGEGLPAPSIFL